MKKTFIPYGDKILIEPVKQEAFLVSDQQPLEEMGKVIGVGSKVKFVKVGDTLFFSSWGVFKTPEVDGKRYYVVPEASEFILGKYNGNSKK